MNHVDSVLERDPDDVVLSEVGSDGSETLSNLVGLVGLHDPERRRVSSQEMMTRRRVRGRGRTYLVSVSSQPVLVRVNSDCGHGELMGGPEDSDGDLLQTWRKGKGHRRQNHEADGVAEEVFWRSSQERARR